VNTRVEACQSERRLRRRNPVLGEVSEGAVTQAPSETYRAAGVDIAAGDEAVRRIAPLARATFRPEVLGGIGAFAGFVRVPSGYAEPVLVSSTDGVGSKLKVAFRADRHDTVGIDLVAMGVNDLLVHGAAPLYFLDYIGIARLDPARVETIVAGVVAGSVALVGFGADSVVEAAAGLVVLWLVTGAALLAAVQAVGASSAASVIERRTEIGLMKALGAGSGTVGFLLAAEQLLLAFVGGGVGYSLGIVLARLLGQKIFGAAPEPSLIVFLVVITLAAGVTVLGSALPLRRASQYEPAPILRGE